MNSRLHRTLQSVNLTKYQTEWCLPCSAILLTFVELLSDRHLLQNIFFFIWLQGHPVPAYSTNSKLRTLFDCACVCAWILKALTQLDLVEDCSRGRMSQYENLSTVCQLFDAFSSNTASTDQSAPACSIRAINFGKSHFHCSQVTLLTSVSEVELVLLHLLPSLDSTVVSLQVKHFFWQFAELSYVTTISFPLLCRNFQLRKSTVSWTSYISPGHFKHCGS